MKDVQIFDSESLRAAIAARKEPFDQLSPAELDTFIATAKFAQGHLAHAELEALQSKTGENGLKKLADLVGIPWTTFSALQNRMCKGNGMGPVGCHEERHIWCDPQHCNW